MSVPLPFFARAEPDPIIRAETVFVLEPPMLKMDGAAKVRSFGVVPATVKMPLVPVMVTFPTEIGSVNVTV
jgi:hypothetical protein